MIQKATILKEDQLKFHSTVTLPVTPTRILSDTTVVFTLLEKKDKERELIYNSHAHLCIDSLVHGDLS